MFIILWKLTDRVGFIYRKSKSYYAQPMQGIFDVNIALIYPMWHVPTCPMHCTNLPNHSGASWYKVAKK